MEIIGIETATYEKTLKEIENFLDTIDKLITASSHKTILGKRFIIKKKIFRSSLKNTTENYEQGNYPR